MDRLRSDEEAAASAVAELQQEMDALKEDKEQEVSQLREELKLLQDELVLSAEGYEATVQGMSLGELVGKLRIDRSGERKEWPTARLVRLFLQVCNAVAYAHSMGVLHRDLKPANIMIGPFEEVLVLDWGMAAVLSDPQEPARGAARGSPESFSGTLRRPLS